MVLAILVAVYAVVLIAALAAVVFEWLEQQADFLPGLGLMTVGISLFVGLVAWRAA